MTLIVCPSIIFYYGLGGGGGEEKFEATTDWKKLSIIADDPLPGTWYARLFFIFLFFYKDHLNAKHEMLWLWIDHVPMKHITNILSHSCSHDFQFVASL